MGFLYLPCVLFQDLPEQNCSFSLGAASLGFLKWQWDRHARMPRVRDQGKVLQSLCGMQGWGQHTWNLPAAGSCPPHCLGVPCCLGVLGSQPWDPA